MGGGGGNGGSPKGGREGGKGMGEGMKRRRPESLNLCIPKCSDASESILTGFAYLDISHAPGHFTHLSREGLHSVARCHYRQFEYTMELVTIQLPALHNSS